MAWPLSVPTLASALATLNEAIEVARDTAAAASARSAADTSPRQYYVPVIRTFEQVITQMNALANTQGLAQYAQNQYANAGLNIAAEFTAVRNALVSLNDWIKAAFPKDPNTGRYVIKGTDAEGSEEALVFTAAELAGFRTRVATFLATIA